MFQYGINRKQKANIVSTEKIRYKSYFELQKGKEILHAKNKKRRLIMCE